MKVLNIADEDSSWFYIIKFNRQELNQLKNDLFNRENLNVNQDYLIYFFLLIAIININIFKKIKISKN